MDLKQKLREKELKFRAWGMQKNPFSINPEPDAIVGLEDEITDIITCIALNSGHVMLTGDYGTGKTTVLKYLKERLPRDYSVLYYPHPPEPELLYSDLEGELKTFFGGYKDKNVVILVDEAHEMENKTEKELRILGDMRNVQLIVAGKPELQHHMREKMPALYDRIVNHTRLGILSENDAVELVRNRIACSGGLESPLTDEEIKKIYRKSSGKARDVLKLLDRRIRLGEGNERYTGLYLPKT